LIFDASGAAPLTGIYFDMIRIRKGSRPRRDKAGGAWGTGSALRKYSKFDLSVMQLQSGIFTRGW
jgi:hypothetical protein